MLLRFTYWWLLQRDCRQRKHIARQVSLYGASQRIIWRTWLYTKISLSLIAVCDFSHTVYEILCRLQRLCNVGYHSSVVSLSAIRNVVENSRPLRCHNIFHCMLSLKFAITKHHRYITRVLRVSEAFYDVTYRTFVRKLTDCGTAYLYTLYLPKPP